MPVTLPTTPLAAQADLDALITRVTALEAGGTKPPIVTPPTESAEATTVPPAASITDALHNVFTIMAGKVGINGTADAQTGSVTTLYYHTHAMVHQNTAGNWYQAAMSGGPPGGKATYTQVASPMPVPPVTGVPPPAAAAGYTNKVIGGSVAPGAVWQAIPGAIIHVNADGSVVISGGGSDYNNQLGTIQKITGGFYAQCTCSWTGNAVWAPGIGWPAFWSTNIAAGLGMTNTEADYMEAMSGGSAYNFGLHNWNPDGSDTNTGNTIGSPGAVPAGTDFSKPHTYGFLSVPAINAATPGAARWYFDGKQIGQTVPITAGGLYSSMATQPNTVMVGSGANNPMTVTSVEVWQRPFSGAAGAGFTASAAGFKDGNGNPWRARGLNGGVKDAQDGFSNVFRQFPAMSCYRLNTGAADSDASIADVVAKYTGHGCVVLIEDHTGTRRDTAWYSKIANTYKGNPLVMIGVPNEPGGDVANDQIAVINAVKGAGFTGLIGLQCIGGYQYDNIDTVTNACGKGQLFLTPHIYYAGTDPNGGEQYITNDINGATSRGLWCVFTEFGDAMNGWQRDMFGLKLVSSVIAAEKGGRCGALFWAMDNDNHPDGTCSAFLTRDGSQLTPVGTDPLKPWLT